MSFPVVLLIAGLILIAIGLLGSVSAQQIQVGTNVRWVRVLCSFLGAIMILMSGYFYMKESGIQESKQPSSLSPDSSSFSIVTPKPGSLKVAVDQGAGLIPVTGTVKGTGLDFDKSAIYVFTNARSSNEWWHNVAVDPDQQGNWTTTALAGSSEEPILKDRATDVTVRAIIADDEKVKAVFNKNKAKFVQSLGEIEHSAETAPVSIKISAQ